jgi:glycosyltransferase involved in cell wall biosynthesis
MRILAVTNLYPNPYQPERAAYNRQQFAAIARSCPVSVISPIAWTDEFRHRRKPGASLPSDRRALTDGIEIDYPRYWFPPKVLRSSYGRFFERSIQNVFRRRVEAFRPHVILASWAYPDGWAAVRLAHKAGLPVVVKVHGSDVLTLTTSAPRQARTATALREADGVIAVSGDLATRVHALGVSRDKVRLIYNGVDAELFHPGPSREARLRLGADQRSLLAVGNLVAVKGLDVLVRACSILKGRGHRFVCCVVGEGPLRAVLEHQIDQLGLRDCVRLVGSRPHGELPDWFRSADVFVLPSHSEGVPNVLLEACACGSRFVASNVGGIPEVAHLGDGRLVEPGNDAKLAAAIEACLRSAAANGVRQATGGMRSHGASASEVIEFLGEIVATWRAFAMTSRSRYPADGSVKPVDTLDANVTPA